MKKVLLSLVIIATLGAKAQIRELEVPKWERVGKINYNIGTVGAELEVSEGRNFRITYFNFKYPSLNRHETIYFSCSQEDLNTLYLAFKNAFSSDDIKEYSKVLTLSKDWIGVVGRRNFGIKAVSISGDRGYSYPMTESQVDKLFNKN